MFRRWGFGGEASRVVVVLVGRVVVAVQVECTVVRVATVVVVGTGVEGTEASVGVQVDVAMTA